jgi:copper chaperone NosL
MKAVIERTNRLLTLPLDAGPRSLLLVASVLIALTCFLPLWNVATFGPEGLRSGSESYELGGPETDARAIAGASDPAGPREAPGDFRELKWVPFAFGVLGLLFLRAAGLGSMGSLVDVAVLFVYLAAYVLWFLSGRFAGHGQSGPGPGAYVIVMILLLLGAALGLAWREGRSEIAAEARMAG